ncbi:MAG: TerB family tellurite resistance protein [Oscillatoria sp. PMC 1051.18]|nr:TerB family tellurite resistance protein [Oscillatoria sp. PMC 1050.18]MEC5031725.1 TerB family tellurite resistance protein [Oscillatoria sp. PMC 1051.18]
MPKTTKTKQLLKILIGAAWIDGTIQAEEREHIKNMAQENNLANDPEIKSLLSEIKQVKPAECYNWLEDYLGENPSKEDYQDLIEAISALIYSDNEVAIEESKLLTRLQLLDPENEPPKSAFDKAIKKIQKLYRQAVDSQS